MPYSNTKIFKDAFSIVRSQSNEIYKGFGFRHLSDATKYYVHPNNISKTGTTTLCQPIGEAVALFCDLINGYRNNSHFGEIYFDMAYGKYFLEITIPDDWHTNEVFDKKIVRYRALIDKDDIKLAAYNQEDKCIVSVTDDYLEHYKICIAFVITLVEDFLSNVDIRNAVNDLLDNPVEERFVMLCEDFYQLNKNETQKIIYLDIKEFNTESLEKFSLNSDNQADDIVPSAKPKPKITEFSPDGFSAEQLSYIPNLSEEFKLDDNLISVCNAVASGDVNSVLLHGPAGTGKTISCKLICQTIKLPIMETINCTENLDEFVLGKYNPEGDKIFFRESFVTKAIRDGGAVVFEEINFAKPQYLAFLNSLLDDNGFVRLDNGEVIKRNMNFRFFATMNVGYFGTKQLNQALYNRFNAVVEVAQLSDNAIKRMLTFRVPECSPFVSKILAVYHKIKKKIETEELDIVISPRNLENWVRLAKYEGYVSAATKTILPVAKCDRLLEKTFKDIIDIYKWE